jgi:hypothetical protein
LGDGTSWDERNAAIRSAVGGTNVTTLPARPAAMHISIVGQAMSVDPLVSGRWTAVQRPCAGSVVAST